MDFSKFKANRGKAKAAAKKLKDQKPSFVDDRFWNITKDAQGNGEAIIRFLPQPNPELEPYILKYVHGFKENGKWFFADCPVTIGKECPSCDHAQPYWDEDTKASRDIAFRYWRKKNYIANILVVKDVAKPENNGKVFLFKFGTKIQEKIMAKINPESEIDEPVWVFDMWDGLNFKLKVRKVGGYPNYDTSEWFGNTNAVADSDEKIEKIFNQMKLLNEFVDEKNFKSYDELKKKFYAIVKPHTGSGGKVATNHQKKESVVDITEETDTKKAVDKETVVEETTPVINDDAGVSDDEFNFDDLSDDDFSFDD